MIAVAGESMVTVTVPAANAQPVTADAGGARNSMTSSSENERTKNRGQRPPRGDRRPAFLLLTEHPSPFLHAAPRIASNTWPLFGRCPQGKLNRGWADPDRDSSAREMVPDPPCFRSTPASDADPSPVVVLRSLPRGRNGDNRSTPPSSPAIELTAIRLEGCPPDAATRWSCSQASALTLQRGPAVGADRQLERLASGRGVAAAEEVDQDPSTSSMALAYKDPSLQNLRVSVIFPSCGMMACAATGAVVSAYEPVNL